MLFEHCIDCISGRWCFADIISLFSSGWVGEGVLWCLSQPCGYQKVFLWLSSLFMSLSVSGRTAHFPSCGQHWLQVGWNTQGGFCSLLCFCILKCQSMLWNTIFLIKMTGKRNWIIVALQHIHWYHQSISVYSLFFKCDISQNCMLLCGSVLQAMLAESSDCPVWLTASQAHCGIVGMVNCLRQEPGGNRIR